ncbi:MAG: hypothetical protein AABW83_00200 [Nanoarchaeota archaeon]
MTENQLPKFVGIPLIEYLKDFPQADFLRGEFGKYILKEYNSRVKEDYSDNKNLRVLSYSDGIIKGSNSFAVVLINQIIRENNLRTATQADLEKILRLNALNLKGFYEDSALVLRSEGEPNSYLAKDLLRQLPAKQKLPVMISLSDLELKKDDNSDYGLAFNLRDNSKVIYNHILEGNTGFFYSKDLDKNGLPKEVGLKGNRNFYSGNSGLSRLYLDEDLDQYADDDDLAISGDSCRVVIVKSAKGAAKKFGRI